MHDSIGNPRNFCPSSSMPCHVPRQMFRSLHKRLATKTNMHARSMRMSIGSPFIWQGSERRHTSDKLRKYKSMNSKLCCSQLGYILCVINNSS